MGKDAASIATEMFRGFPTWLVVLGLAVLFVYRELTTRWFPSAQSSRVIVEAREEIETLRLENQLLELIGQRPALQRSYREQLMADRDRYMMDGVLCALAANALFIFEQLLTNTSPSDFVQMGSSATSSLDTALTMILVSCALGWVGAVFAFKYIRSYIAAIALSLAVSNLAIFVMFFATSLFVHTPVSK